MSAAPGRPKQARTAGEAGGHPVTAAPGRPKQARTAGEAGGLPVSLAWLPDTHLPDHAGSAPDGPRVTRLPGPRGLAAQGAAGAETQVDGAAPDAAALERRVLLRAATTKDALMSVAVLERAGLVAHVCPSLQALVAEVGRGAGAIVLSEEALGDPAAPQLVALLQDQPGWSDLPVLVLARQGADSRVIGQAMDTVANVTVIERPVRVASFVSSVRSALRARARQYDLRGTLQGLREADQRKTEFLATLAHELRNPLAPLMTALTLLKRKRPGPDEATRYHDMMRRQVDHMVRLVNDLMEVSRITRGKIELDQTALDLHRVLEEAADLSRPLLEGAQHELRVDMPAQPLVVHGDGVRLTQVFSNLLNNAAKYTPRAGHITLTARREDGDAVITVRDDGIGIAPDMLDDIFDMFVQVSGTAKTAQGGLGIGLTLVKSLVELHGGKVWAASGGPGRGSTFGVRLPLADAVPATPDLVPAHGTAPAGAATTVLVVDDNQDAADSLAEALRAMGLRASVAYSGPQALAQLPALKPGVAVLDLGMPGMDGTELATRIRQDPANAGMVLVALTGWGQQRDREQTQAAGFDHHLVKPMDVERLVAILQGAHVPDTGPGSLAE
jgi:signal transduction histidine kinase/ActR/RegA family two-component response regulator